MRPWLSTNWLSEKWGSTNWGSAREFILLTYDPVRADAGTWGSVGDTVVEAQRLVSSTDVSKDCKFKVIKVRASDLRRSTILELSVVNGMVTSDQNSFGFFRQLFGSVDWFN